MSATVSQQAVEIISQGNPNPTVSQLAVEFLIQHHVNGVSAQIAVEVMTKAALPPKTSRSWRLDITSNNGGSVVGGIAKIELRGTPGGSDLATGGVASSSSDGSGSSAANAFDADSATAWDAAAAGPQWIQYDFTSEVSIAEVVVTPSAGTTDKLPKDFSVKFNGNNGWEKAIDVRNESSWQAGQPKTFRSYLASRMLLTF